MSIEEVRKSARGALHEFMGRPVSYYADPLEPNPVQLVIKAREHTKAGQVGDLAGTNLSYAEVHDRAERLRFWLEDLPDPKRHALVIFSETVGYFINNVLPDDGLTIDCEVIRAGEEELTGFLLPDGTVIGA